MGDALGAGAGGAKAAAPGPDFGAGGVSGAAADLGGGFGGFGGGSSLGGSLASGVGGGDLGPFGMSDPTGSLGAQMAMTGSPWGDASGITGAPSSPAGDIGGTQSGTTSDASSPGMNAMAQLSPQEMVNQQFGAQPGSVPMPQPDPRAFSIGGDPNAPAGPTAPTATPDVQPPPGYQASQQFNASTPNVNGAPGYYSTPDNPQGAGGVTTVPEQYGPLSTSGIPNQIQTQAIGGVTDNNPSSPQYPEAQFPQTQQGATANAPPFPGAVEPAATPAAPAAPAAPAVPAAPADGGSTGAPSTPPAAGGSPPAPANTGGAAPNAPPSPTTGAGSPGGGFPSGPLGSLDRIVGDFLAMLTGRGNPQALMNDIMGLMGPGAANAQGGPQAGQGGGVQPGQQVTVDGNTYTYQGNGVVTDQDGNRYDAYTGRQIGGDQYKGTAPGDTAGPGAPSGVPPNLPTPAQPDPNATDPEERRWWERTHPPGTPRISPYQGTPRTGRANFMHGQFGGPGRNIVSAQAGGVNIQGGLNRAAVPAITGFLNELKANGAPINTVYGYTMKNIQGTNQVSQHSYGNAIDINQRGKNISPELAQWSRQHPGLLDRIAAKYNMVNGVTFGDFGHFEWSPGPGYNAYRGRVPGSSQAQPGTQTASLTQSAASPVQSRVENANTYGSPQDPNDPIRQLLENLPSGNSNAGDIYSSPGPAYGPERLWQPLPFPGEQEHGIPDSLID